jgi:hypothetical protein
MDGDYNEEGKEEDGQTEQLEEEDGFEDPEVDYSVFAESTPLRLTADERAKLFLTKGALVVSDYTDKVDIMPGRYGGASRGKMTRILSQLEDVLSTLLGLLVASNFREGNKLVDGRKLCDNADFFQQVFEIARRFKIMNPGRLRDTYGKMIYMLQDAATSSIQKALGFKMTVGVKNVHRFLEERGGLRLLADGRIEAAIRYIPGPSETTGRTQSQVLQFLQQVSLLLSLRLTHTSS